MAITNTCVRFLLWAKKQGASYEKTLTLGHLENLTEKDKIYTLAKEEPNLIQFGKIDWQDTFCDTIFSALGATAIESLDFSDYENACLNHDLNIPLHTSCYGRYSIIIDGGTLEHVFNITQAFKNCMQSLSIGGHFVGFSPANNLMGHGFYQFSPEFFFRVFSEENGFKIIGMFLVAAGFDVDATTWYEVSDPKEIKERVTLTNKLPVYIMILAKKIADVEPFKNQVYQSDYIETWNKSIQQSDKAVFNKPALLKRIFNRLTGQNFIEENLERINPKFFRRRKN